MTRYILSGGYPWKAPDGGKAFFEELARGYEEPVKILECLFARPEDAWTKAYVEEQELVARLLPDKNIEFQLARRDAFIEQIRWANTIYLRGGDTAALLAALAQYPGWEKELGGKTLAGGSAGAMVIAKYSYSIDELALEDGLGLLPIKVQVHYRSDYNAPHVDWDNADEALASYKEKLPVWNLGEGEFKVFER